MSSTGYSEQSLDSESQSLANGSQSSQHDGEDTTTGQGSTVDHHDATNDPDHDHTNSGGNNDGDDDDDDDDDEGTTVLIRFADDDDHDNGDDDDDANDDADNNTDSTKDAPDNDDTDNTSSSTDTESTTAVTDVAASSTTSPDTQPPTTDDTTTTADSSDTNEDTTFVEESDYDFTADISPRGRTESVSNYDKKLMDVQIQANRQRLEFERARALQQSQPPKAVEPSRKVFRESKTEIHNQQKRDDDMKRRHQQPVEITKLCVYYDLSLIRTDADIQSAMDYLRGKVPPQLGHLFDSQGNLIDSKLFESNQHDPSQSAGAKDAQDKPSTSTSTVAVPPPLPTIGGKNNTKSTKDANTNDNESNKSTVAPITPPVTPTSKQKKPKEVSNKDKMVPAVPLPDYMSPDYPQPLTFDTFMSIIRSQIPSNLKARFPKDGLFSGKGYKKQDHHILFYHQYIFDTKFDPENRLHVLLLNSVYMRLMCETTPPQLTGEHWVKNSITFDTNPTHSLKVRGFIDLIKPRQYKSNDYSIYPLFVGLYLLDGINDKHASDVFRILLRNIHKRSEPAPEVCIFDFFTSIGYVMRFYHHKTVSKFIPQIATDYSKEQYRYMRGERNLESYLFYMIEFLAAGLLTKYYRNYLTLNTLISAAISLREMLFNDSRGLERLLHDPVPAGPSRALVSFVPGSYQLFLSEINEESYYQIPLSVPFLAHLRKRGVDLKKEEQIQSKYKPQGAEISTHRSSLYVPVIQSEKPEREIGKPTIHHNDGKSVKGGKKPGATPPPVPAAVLAAAKKNGEKKSDDNTTTQTNPEDHNNTTKTDDDTGSNGDDSHKSSGDNHDHDNDEQSHTSPENATATDDNENSTTGQKDTAPAAADNADSSLSPSDDHNNHTNTQESSPEAQ